jgi:hypothetical protein
LADGSEPSAERRGGAWTKEDKGKHHMQEGADVTARVAESERWSAEGIRQGEEQWGNAWRR